MSASDISDSMAVEAGRRASEMGIENAKFYTSDLESVTGKYNTVTCVDVAIHYPTEKMAEMVASRSAEKTLAGVMPKIDNVEKRVKGQQVESEMSELRNMHNAMKFIPRHNK